MSSIPLSPDLAVAHPANSFLPLPLPEESSFSGPLSSQDGARPTQPTHALALQVQQGTAAYLLLYTKLLRTQWWKSTTLLSLFLT